VALVCWFVKGLMILSICFCSLLFGLCIYIFGCESIVSDPMLSIMSIFVSFPEKKKKKEKKLFWKKEIVRENHVKKATRKKDNEKQKKKQKEENKRRNIKKMKTKKREWKSWLALDT